MLLTADNILEPQQVAPIRPPIGKWFLEEGFYYLLFPLFLRDIYIYTAIDIEPFFQLKGHSEPDAF